MVRKMIFQCFWTVHNTFLRSGWWVQVVSYWLLHYYPCSSDFLSDYFCFDLSIAVSGLFLLYPRITKYLSSYLGLALCLFSVEHILLMRNAWLKGIPQEQCLGRQLWGKRNWCLFVSFIWGSAIMIPFRIQLVVSRKFVFSIVSCVNFIEWWKEK